MFALIDLPAVPAAAAAVHTVSSMTAPSPDLLDATDDFAAARRDAAAAGAWSSSLHAIEHARRPLRSVSTADDLTVSEEHMYWVSELGRLTELAGALAARCDVAATAAKAARARARATLRQADPEARWTVSALEDAAEADAAVISADALLTRCRLAAAHAAAAKEATAAYVAGLSREITLRGDAKRARMY